MRVVLDACVLYPPSLRDLILTLAGLDAFELRWSHQILEEFERNVLTDFPDINPKRFRAHTIAAMTTNFPDAFQRESDAEIEIIGVHPKDQHVASLALATQSDTIVTQNLRHFPTRALAKNGLRAISSGTFITELDRSEPAQIDQVIQSLARRWKNPPKTVNEILELIAVHPTMATPIKALKERFEGS